MERHIKQRWNDSKLNEIAKRFGTSVENLNVLDGFASFIYEFEDDGQGYILRIGHSERRSPGMIHAEVDWINYLADNGANVAQAIQSKNGNLIEILDDGHGEKFLATAFIKASGGHLGFDQWTPEFIQHYGEVIGKIHYLSKTYKPSKPEWQRLHWEDVYRTKRDEWVEVAEPFMIKKVDAIIDRIAALPKDDVYHMIHEDAHSGNFYVDQGQITLFDFDDCLYGYEIYDISMVIFYGPINKDLQVTEHFIKNFLIGYIRENSLDPKRLAYIPDLLKLREIEMYILIERDVDWRSGEDWWAQRFMPGRYERIVNETPVTDFDFSLLADILSK